MTTWQLILGGAVIFVVGVAVGAVPGWAQSAKPSTSLTPLQASQLASDWASVYHYTFWIEQRARESDDTQLLQEALDFKELATMLQIQSMRVGVLDRAVVDEMRAAANRLVERVDDAN